jgi:PAS domain S-box-containing protein
MFDQDQGFDQRILEQVINQSPISVVVTNINGNIVFVNAAFTEISGYEAPEVTGRNPRIFNSETHDKSFFKNLWDTVLSGNVWNGEVLNRKKDGTLYWEKEVISPIFDDKKAISYFVCTKENINDIKETEIALINSEIKFKSFFKQSNSAILVFNPEKQSIIEANDAAIEYYGYSVEEFQNLNLKDEFFGFLDILQKELAESGKKSKTGFNQKHRLKNKQIRDVEIYPARVVSQDKVLIYINVFDITQRKKAIEALKESEAKKLALLKIIPDLIFVLNSKGEFVDIYTDNPSSLTIEPHKLLGKKVQYFFPEEMSGQLKEKIEAAIRTREVQTFEFRYKRDHEKYVFEEVRIIASADGEVLVIIRDVSKQKNYEIELKKAWEEAEEAIRVKSVFLANISHEIRTPLNAILGFSDILYNELRNTSNQHYVEAIKDSSKTLLNLINDLLDLSRIEAGKMNITYSETNIPILFNEIQKIHSLKLKEKKLDYSSIVEDSVPTLIRFDEFRLRQILLNIIGNAIKFTDVGKIEVMVSALNYRLDFSTSLIDLIISIKDTGIGIDRKNQSEIFEAFKQQDAQDTRKYGGTGLGLAISKRLVEILNGTIDLESIPGKGSVFTITFNDVEVLSSHEQSFRQKQDFKVGEVFFKPEPILIADDVAVNRFFLKGIFKGSQMSFFEAENGEEAIELVRKHKPTLAMLDLRMPIVDGLDVAMYIKTSEEFRNIITFGLSATDISYEMDSRIRYLDEFLSKPLDIQLLLKKISKYIPRVEQPNMLEKSSDITFQQLRIEKSVKEKFAQILKDEIYPYLEKISHTSSFTDYDIFSKILIEKGAELKINQLTFIGNLINEAVRNFDLDAISRELNEYRKFEKYLLESQDE